MPGEDELVGRSGELATLSAWLATACRGQGRAALLAGEPGIGKTSLAGALAVRARAAGARVLWGRCWETGGQPAWWPMTQALGALIDDGVVDADVLRRAGPGLLLVLPEASALLPELVPLAAPDPDTAAFAVARAVTRVLRECTARQPHVLVIDDLHAADPATLRLLAVLAGEARALPLLIVATLRDAEARTRPDAAALLAELTRDAVTLRVPRLEPDAARLLLDRAAPALDPGLAARVLDAAAGNPLYLGEVAALLSAGAPAGAEVPVPAGVRDAIRSRLVRLPADTRSLVEALAVLGGHALLARAAALAEVADAAAAAAPALAVEVLLATGDRVRLSHGLVRDVAYGDLAPARRRHLHVAAADQLAAAAAAGDDEALAEAARHLLDGGPEAGERALAAALAAAAAASARGAYDDAAAVLDDARHRLPAAALPPARRVELLAELGRALLRAARLKEGRAVCDEAAALAESLGDAELFARVVVVRGTVFRFGHVDATLVDLLRRAADGVAGRGTALEARVLARLAAAEQPAMPPDGPLARARQAIAMARGLGDPETLLYVLHDAMSACMDYDDPAARLPCNRELRDLARRLGDRWVEQRALTRMVFDLLEAGDMDGADGAVAALDAVARWFGHPQHWWPVSLLRVAREAFEGRFASAERHAGEAVALGGDDPRLPPMLAVQRFARLRAGERPAEEYARLAAEAGDLFVAIGGNGLFAAMFAASARARCGDLEGTRRALPAAVGALAFGDPVTHSLIAEAAALVGDRALAARLHPYLAARAHLFLTWGASFAFVEDPLSRYQGLLATVLGRRDEAVACHEDAVARLRAVRGRAFLARNLLDLAEAWLAREGAGDAERAAAAAAEAADLAGELDQVGLRPRLDALVAGRPAATSVLPLVAPAFALAREGDSWTISGRGRSFRLKDGRGLRVLAQLVEHPGQDLHVLDLSESKEGLIDGGDAGELLDARARDQYRARLIDAREELQEAERINDLGWTERLRGEVEALEDELTRGFGMGGRARRSGAAAERARSAVTRRVKQAIARIREQDDELGAYLGLVVRTGITCSYRPFGR